MSTETPTFKVGDNAVYPGHGVGKVVAVEAKEIMGTRLEFYSVQIIETGMKIMVPKNNVNSVGLRTENFTTYDLDALVRFVILEEQFDAAQVQVEMEDGFLQDGACGNGSIV